HRMRLQHHSALRPLDLPLPPPIPDRLTNRARTEIPLHIRWRNHRIEIMIADTDHPPRPRPTPHAPPQDRRTHRLNLGELVAVITPILVNRHPPPPLSPSVQNAPAHRLRPASALAPPACTAHTTDTPRSSSECSPSTPDRLSSTFLAAPAIPRCLYRAQQLSLEAVPVKPKLIRNYRMPQSPFDRRLKHAKRHTKPVLVKLELRNLSRRHRFPKARLNEPKSFLSRHRHILLPPRLPLVSTPKYSPTPAPIALRVPSRIPIPISIRVGMETPTSRQ